MTVKELLDELKFMDKDAIVVLPGYEDGYNAVRAAIPTFMVDYPDPKWYYGAFEEADAGMSAVILR
jgi:hypothetical protein